MHKNKVYIIYRNTHTHTTFTLANKYGVKLINVFSLRCEKSTCRIRWHELKILALHWSDSFLLSYKLVSLGFSNFSGVPNDWHSYSTPFHAQLVRERNNAVNTTHLRCWFLTHVPREEKRSTDKRHPTNIATIPSDGIHENTIH